MPIYRHHLQNRRLRVQVLVPLPNKNRNFATQVVSCGSFLFPFFRENTELFSLIVTMKPNRDHSWLGFFVFSGALSPPQSLYLWVIVKIMGVSL